MQRQRKTWKTIIASIVLIVVFMNALPNPVSGEVQPIDEMEGKLQQVSEAEKAVLEDLFTLSQKIGEMQNKEKQINEQLETMKADIGTLSARIEDSSRSYEDQLEVLKRVLVGYQKRGPASLLETFLSAGDLTTFLKSLNILKDMSKNSKEFLESINEAKKHLEEEKAQLAEKELMVQKTKEELEKAINEMLVLRSEQEKILASLADQREAFEAELSYIENMWAENKELFSNIVFHFNNIIQQGNLPVDKLGIQIVFPYIRITLSDELLNEVLANQTDIPAMVFSFHPDGIVVEVPEKQLSLQCHYVIEERRSITFVIDEGSFYGMPLTESSISELLQNGSLQLDFRQILGMVTVESARIFEGYMEFDISPVLDDEGGQE